MIKLMKNQNIKKDFFWNTLGSGINAFNSLFFLIIVTRINGVNDAGIFTLAFSTANLFNIIGVYSGRVFQVTDTSKIKDNDYFFHKIITCIIMLFVSLGFVLFRGYNLWKSSIILILCLLKTFEAFAEVIYAFFQKKQYLYRVGISLTLKNIFGLLIFFVVDILTNNVFLASMALVINYLFIMFIYDFKYLDYKEISFKKIIPKNIISIFKTGFFAFCLSFLTIFLVNIPRYVIDSNLNDNYSTIFGILIMPATVIVLMAQFVLHPLLIKIKDVFKINIKKFSILILKLVGVVFAFGVFSVFISYIIGIPFLEFIYNINLSEYRNSLVIIMSGATLYGISILLSNILISMRITFSQIIIYLISSISSMILSHILILKRSIEGAAISYFLSMLITFVLFIALIIYSIYKTNTKKIIDKKKVSVIVPIYNSSKFLDRCIDSILNQTYNNTEVILINDGSTDDSLEKINIYQTKYSQIKVFSKENGGSASARNYGLEKASGEYILFVDSDDSIDNDYIENLILNIDDNDCIVCGYKRYNNKKLLYKKKPKNTHFSIYKFNATCCKLYKTKLLKDNNIKFPLNYKIGEDIYFTIQVINSTNKIKFIKYAGYNNYINLNSITSTANKTKENRNKLMLPLLKDIEKIANYKIIKCKMHLFFYLKTIILHLLTQRYILNEEEYYLEYKNYFGWFDEICLKHTNKKMNFYWQKGEEFKINLICNLFVVLRKIKLEILILKLLQKTKIGVLK